MARRLRTLFAGIPTHVVQRGNDRKPCFFADHDRHYYLEQLEACSQAFGCAVHAYVLMDNHVHLLVTPSTPDGVSLLMKHLGQRYVQHVNRIRPRTGALWEGRFHSSVVDSGAYLFTCHRYIEMNPVRAGMVRRPGDFRWSSYRANAEGESSTILTPHRDYVALSADERERRERYRMLFELTIDDGAIRVIREMTRGGFAFGSEDFRRRLEVACGRSMSPSRQRGLTPNPPLGV
jgi:putative transposase